MAAHAEFGRFATINELAAAEKINFSYVSRVLRLTLLAPDIVEAILDGRQPDGMTLPRLMEPLPVVWEAQRETLAVAEPAAACGCDSPRSVTHRLAVPVVDAFHEERIRTLLRPPSAILPTSASPAVSA